MAVTHLKACYKEGATLQNGSHWVMEDNLDCRTEGSRLAANAIYIITPAYKRINNNGYGCRVSRQGAIISRVKVPDIDSQFHIRTDVKTGDVASATVRLNKQTMERISILFGETYHGSTISPIYLSDLTEYDIGAIVYEADWKVFQEQTYDLAAIPATTLSFTFNDMNDFNFRFITGAEYTVAAQLNQSKTFIKKFITAGISAGQTDPYSYTYYQYQYAIMTRGTGYGNNDIVYLSPEAAEAYCRANYEWCTPVEETTE